MEENNKNTFTRTRLREQAFCLLFGYSLYKPDNNELNDYYETTVNINGYGDSPYLRSVFFGVTKEKDALDGIISKYAVGWKTERISKASLTLMRICLYESKYIDDVPAAVAINEAVVLAKKYDTEKAPAFINGILNAAAKGEGYIE